MNPKILEDRKTKQLERLLKVLSLRIPIPPPSNSKLETDCLIHREGVKDFENFYYQGSIEKIYRLVYMLEHGKLKKGQNVLHYCNRNECSEISHLYLKTSRKEKEKKDIEKEELEEIEKDLQEFISTLKKGLKNENS